MVAGESAISIYQLKRDADNSIIVYQVGNQVIKLEGGFADVIVMTYQNMSTLGEHRGDDYMAGVIAGIMHCHMLRPDAFRPLPEVPPIDPDPT